MRDGEVIFFFFQLFAKDIDDDRLKHEYINWISIVMEILLLS